MGLNLLGSSIAEFKSLNVFLGIIMVIVRILIQREEIEPIA